MARKRHTEEHENHDRWLVSYADFITLLFAFFVVMYSISSVNEGKYRVLSDALDAAFRASERALEPIQVGQPARMPYNIPPELRRRPSVIELPRLPLRPQSRGTEGDPNVRQVGEAMQRNMQPLIDKDLIKVRRDKQWVEIEINNSVLFPSGSARLAREAAPVLRQIADILKPHPNAIRVEGFTDNVPIRTEQFPSNWELSAARAASVVHMFTRLGIDPRRMAAVGYGEYQPVADNRTEEGRRRNRRVVLVVLAGTDVRQMSDESDAEISQALERNLESAPTGIPAP